MRHDPRTHRLQPVEALLLLAAFEAFGRQSFTRQELCDVSELPISCVTGRVFTLLERGAFRELPLRRNRAALLEIVIKQPRKRK
jgi:hypothetical protein